MHFNEYQKTKKELYKRFSELVATTLKNILTDANFVPQQIQAREKSLQSLYRKLLDNKLTKSRTIEKKIKDLAGCRVIFYYNDDMELFLRSNVIEKDFEIEPESYKLFNATESPRSSNDCYTATSLVISFKVEKTLLPEYSEFLGLRCELQITTLLNHAFSETNHDIAYKRPDAEEYGQRIVDDLDNALKEVMLNYLLPAGYQLQKIRSTYQRLIEGKEILDGIFREIKTSKDRNELYELLNKYKTYVLPHYDNYERKIDEILDLTNLSLEMSRQFSYKDIATPSGIFPGYKHIYILEKVLEILNYVRFVDQIKIFNAYIYFYQHTTEQEEKKLVLSSLETLIQYTVKSTYNFYLSVCSVIASWGDDSFHNYREIIAQSAKLMLQIEFNEYKNDFESTKIIPHLLEVKSELKNIRKESIQFLIKLFSLSQHTYHKVEIINIFSSGTWLPKEFNNKTLILIIENIIQILIFFDGLLPNEQFDVLIHIENYVFSKYQLFKSIITKHLNDKKLVNLYSDFQSLSLKFANKLNENDRYTFYKLFIGYNSKFLIEWQDDALSYQERTWYREKEIENVVSQIKKENYPFWKDIISLCVDSQLQDGTTFTYFIKFIDMVGCIHPELIYELIINSPSRLNNFIPYFLKSIYFENFQYNVKTLISNWIKKGEFLESCAQLFILKNDEPIDEKIFLNILKKSTLMNNVNAITMIIRAFVSAYTHDQAHLISKIFLPALLSLKKYRNTEWVGVAANNIAITEILNYLTDDQIDIVLNSLIDTKVITDQIESILFPICKKYPSKIVNFFEKRFNLRNEQSYEPIPFVFYKIHDCLSENIISLDLLCNWYCGNYHDFFGDGAKLISIIYQKYTQLVDLKLRKLLENNFKLNLPIVMAILSYYNGGPEIHPICKMIITNLSKSDKKLNELRSIILGESWLISTQGHFGVTHYYEDKKQLLDVWFKDGNTKIASFANKTINILNNRIAHANRRASHDVAMNKLNHK